MFSLRAAVHGAFGVATVTSLVASTLVPSVTALAEEIVRDHRGEGGPVVRQPSPPDPSAPPPIVRDHWT